MKAITILQPWASLIAFGAKRIETRSWPTKHRGSIAIHAGKNIRTPACAWKEPFFTVLKSIGMMGDNSEFHLSHNGKVIAIADLVDCEEMTIDKIVVWRDVYGKDEIAFGDFQPGRYAWILDNVRLIEPVPAKGKQRLWEWKH